MEKTQANVPTQSDERVMAGLSHLLGLIPALIFWAVKKDESPYVRHQALQAIFYNIFMMVASLVILLLSFGLMLLLMLIGFAVTLITLGLNDPESVWIAFSAFGFFFTLFPSFFGIFFLVLIPLRIIGFIAAIQTFMGKPWRYPLIANWVDRVGTGAPKGQPSKEALE